MKDGWHSLKNKEYHKEDGLSSSGIVQILKSPAHYDRREEYKETDVMIQGRALHALTLEPNEFEGMFRIMNEGERRSLKIKKEEAERGRSILTIDGYKEVERWGRAIYEHPYARKLLEINGIIESSGFWVDSKTGVMCKVRPDKKIPGLKTIIDIKTVSLAMESSMDMDYVWSKKIANMKYHIQAAWYMEGCSILDGIEYENFIWIVVAKEPPYFVGVWYADEEMLEIARIDIDTAIKTYAQCLKSGNWPKPDFPGIREAKLPNWALKNYQ